MKKFKGTTQRIFIFFLGILLILGNLTPIFSGIGISSAFAEEKKPYEQNILSNRLFDNYPAERIQTFLNSQPTSLKNIVFQRKNTVQTPAKLLEMTYMAPGLKSDPRTILVFMELFSNAVTKNSFSEEELKNILKVPDSLYRESRKRYLTSYAEVREAIKDPAVFKRVIREIENSDAKYFGYQVAWISSELAFTALCREDQNFHKDCPGDEFIFRDGTSLKAASAINAETFAVQYVLAKLAPNRESWIHWISQDEGSFYRLYKNWFGSPLAMTSDTQYIYGSDTPFLSQKPYQGMRRLNSYFDHNTPTYGNAVGNDNDQITIFTDKKFATKNSGDCELGYSCYDGHDGIDYSTQSNDIYSAACGVVDWKKGEDDEPKMYGNAVFLKHDADNINCLSQENHEPSDYVTTYNHLASIDSGLIEGKFISANTRLGQSGATGCDGCDPHLHFMLYRYRHAYDASGTYQGYKYLLADPYGWWGEKDDVAGGSTREEASSYASTSSLWIWETPTFQNGVAVVDDLDPSFQHLNRSGAEWNVDSTHGYNGGQALWTNSMKDPALREWDDWAFWAVQIPESGEYRLSAYIPDFDFAPTEKTTTSEARYTIFYEVTDQNGVSQFLSSEVKADQNTLRGAWASLGQFRFEESARVGVRLVDESKETGKVIWADAMRFEEVRSDEDNPDLKINSSGTSLMKFTDGSAELTTEIENSSSMDAEDVKLCVSETGKETSFVESVGEILKESVEKVVMKLKNFFFGETDPQNVEVSICDSYPEDADLSNNVVEIPRNSIKSVSTTDPSGVDFSSIDLAGIQLNPTTDSIDFILKGIEGSGGLEVDTVREEVRKTFMSALVISNWKQVVSLPIGSVDIQSPFEQTDLARVMLEADVAMKFDLFSPSTLNLEDLYNQWVSLVKQSPYWSDLQRKGFNVFPSWQARGTIVPRETLVNVEDDKIFLNEATLGLDTAMEWVTIDLSAYSLSTEIVNDLNSRLATWKDLFVERLRSVAPSVEQKFKTDTKYQKLREVYPAVALAHWYKTLPRENLPYADIIDSQNLTGLESATLFDKNYWTAQSDQRIGDFSFSDFYGGKWDGYVHGGVVFDIAVPEDQGTLTETQENILTNVLENYTSVQEGNDYYLYGGNMTMPSSDLGGYLVIDEDEVVPGKDLTLTVRITNSDSEAVSVAIPYRISVKVKNESGVITQYSIVERSVNGISGWNVADDSLVWRLPNVVGTYTFLLEVDPSDIIPESVETNNFSETIVDGKSAYPEAQIFYPENGSLVGSLNSTFYGSGFDFQDGDLSSENLSWSSDRQGFLGNGNAITVAALVNGLHVITLTVIDSDGLTHSTQINISVPEPGSPVVKITSPIEGQRLPSDTEVIFTADALDYEDGVLLGAALLWSSNVDGDFGSGEWLSVKSLSIGNHTITLKATDSDSLSTETVVHITVEQGPPTVSLSAPTDGSKFYQHDNISFSGTANDIQDGNMTSKMEWYSSRDGFMGTGSPLTKNLSVGEHTITLHTMDSDGQVAEKTIKVRVDYTPPVATFSSPKDGDEFPYFGSITFSGSAADTQDGALSGENLIWESNQNGFLGTGSPLTVSNLAPGYHTITFTAVDKDEATDVETVTIYIDAGQPRVLISSPADGQGLFYKFSYTFSGSAEDDLDGAISGSNLIWSSNLDGEIGRGTSIIVSSLSVGEHVITLRATDSEGWLGELSRKITVTPPHAPEVSLIKPRDGENIIHGDTLQLRASVRDYEDGTLTGNSIAWISNLSGEFAHGDNVSFDSTSLSLGNHMITLRATDSLGATTEVSTQITITNRPPIAEILSPTESENIFVQDQTITFSGRGSDLEDSSNLTYTWSSNINGNLGSGSTISVSALALSVGTHTITFTVNDTQLATHTDQVSIIVVAIGSTLLNTFSDGSREKIFDFNPSGGYFSTDFRVPKNAIVSHSILSLEGQYEEGVNVSGNQTTSIQNSAPEFVDIDADGDKDLFIRVEDITGNHVGSIRFYKNDGTPKDPRFISFAEFPSLLRLGMNACTE